MEDALGELKLYVEKAKKLLTISAGIYSSIPDENDAFEDFYSKADIALYESKNNGNTIVFQQ